MFDTAKIQQAFGKAAAHYDQHASLQHSVRARCMALAAETWTKPADIADIGCGTGAFAQAAPAHWRVIGLDVAYGMCAVAGKQHEVVNADAAALPFKDGCVDGVFSSLMLQWANDPAQVLREMQRVLRPGGACVIATLVAGTLGELHAAFAQVDNAPHVSVFHQADFILRQAEHVGLCVKNARQETITEHHPHVRALMKSLKQIGANNKLIGRKKSMMTPAMLRKLEAAYRANFSSEAGIAASWQVLYAVLQKP